MGDARLGLKLLFWGAGSETAIRLVQTAWYRSERGSFRFGSHSIENLSDALNFSIPIFIQLASLAAMVLMAVGAWRVARSAKGRASIFLWSAMAGFAGFVLGHLPSVAFSLKIIEHTALPDKLWGIINGVAFLLITLGQFALLLGMRELAVENKVRIPWIAGIALGTMWLWDAVYWLLLIRWLGFHFSNEWHLLIVATEVAETILLLALLDGLASALETPKAVPASQWGQNAGWQLAADGLRSYTSALLGRLYVTLGAIVFILMGAFGGIPQLVVLVVIALPILTVLFSIWMLIGIKRFADFVPQETEARASGGVAVKLMIASAVLDGIALIMLLLVFVDRHALENAEETISVASNTALLLGMGGMFILLGTFRRVGRFIGNADVVRRARTSTILIGLSAVILTELRSLGPDAARTLRHSEGFALLILVLMVIALLVLAIWGLVVYVGLLRRLRDAVLDGTVAATTALNAPRQSAL